MIHVDVTKTDRARHRSGLTRVTSRLLEELGAAARPAHWPQDANRWAARDWFVTAELFSEDERPGFSAFLQAKRCRTAAVFHDAIPLKHPHITWPQSVARHPAYMKLLASFERVFAVSAASRDELLGFWRWQGLTHVPAVDVLPLGANFGREPRVTTPPAAAPSRSLLCVGIIELRKNQSLLLDACPELWAEGLRFELHVVGRVNPHFGPPIVARMRELQRRYPSLHFHEAPDDQQLAALFRNARASVFPTIAEGCGLPLLESLWLGVPCVCSDLPVLRENADAGGCLPVPANDHAAWKKALRRMLEDDALHARLRDEAAARILPTWRDTARTLAAALT